MRRPRIRAFVAAASAALLGLSLLVPAGALGGAATKATDHFVELFCDGLTGPGGTLFFGATISDVNGASAGLDAFAPGDEPFVDPPAFTADGDAQPSGSAANGTFHISIPVLDAAGDPAGSATIDATLVAGGEIQPIDDGLATATTSSVRQARCSRWRSLPARRRSPTGRGSPSTTSTAPPTRSTSRSSARTRPAPSRNSTRTT